jgi:tellurite resistance protein TerC
MPGPYLFPFAEYWWFYAAFTAFVLLLLGLDLGVFHRKAHVVSFREASIWTAVWICLALIFNYGLYAYSSWRFPQVERLTSIAAFDPAGAARQVSLEFLTGYIVEKSLSVDNIFVFVVVFGYFGIPAMYQHRILFYGILGALLFRAMFIAAGAVLMRYHWVVVAFGVLLIATGIKMFFASDKPVEPEKNLLVRLTKRFLPVTHQIEGQSFFVKHGGRRYATPLLIALVFLEATDIIFAVDSVPAIFALTKEPMIVFTSNIFAILGLRAMYFMLAGAIHKFHMLNYGLAVVLVFVGLKMVWLNNLFGGKFPITWSLGIISAAIGASVVSSLIWPKVPASIGTGDPEVVSPERQNPH